MGLVYIFVFAGIIAEGQAILGPHGIAQLAEFFTQLHQLFPHRLEAFIHAPSLFWLSGDAGMITALSWLGLGAAFALTLNLWPRLALAACWTLFLSFVATWRAFSPAQLDRLMLEVALLCLPFAPAGFRPGLGASSSPRPIALFMVRWLLFRVMFESGLVKIFAGDAHWREFTAMNVMYETSPFPTFFGYVDHHLPHIYHLFEIAVTFAAEIAAPLLAVFGGRRGRWFAFISWTAFQLGIQLTNNFGWLNLASIGLGLMLLDDQMLTAAATRFRLIRLSTMFARIQASVPPSLPGWRLTALRSALWAHFALTLLFFTKAVGIQVTELPALLSWPIRTFNEFQSANAYVLYATFEPTRFQVEFEGSNDRGATWRTYEYRYIPQHEDRISPFIAPWFPRFEGTLQIESWNNRKSEIYPAVAAHLLTRNPEVMTLFASDPFKDQPAQLLRMRGYRLTFTDFATWRRTGHYWTRTPLGEYLPMLQRSAQGAIASIDFSIGEEALQRGDAAAAFRFFSEHYRLGVLAAGFRVAEMATRGFGTRPDPSLALAIYTALAHEGELGAEHYLGICHEYGIGTQINYARAAEFYRASLARGYIPSLYSLGALYATDRLTPRDNRTGLTLLIEAAGRAAGEDPYSRFVRDHEPALARQLMARMDANDIAAAQRTAATRLKASVTAVP